jgi:dTDP-4-dehydrorhamnose reductase
MKILILGSNGMLGNTMTRYFSSSEHKIVASTRSDIDLFKASFEDLDRYISEISPDVIVNCAGIIKQRTDTDSEVFLKVNSVIPRFLDRICIRDFIRLIHITTDCVFSGKKGNYSEKDTMDVNDIYGMSKWLGEKLNSTVIRSSIIGQEVNTNYSLFNWFSSQEGTVKGYETHLWNGVTCLQMSKICLDIIDNNKFWSGIRHIHSDTYSKYELLVKINEVFDMGKSIRPWRTGESIDRTLSTLFPLYTDLNLETQLREMKDFLIKKY